MEMNRYQAKAMRTLNPKLTKRTDILLEGLMGLNGEAGEAIEIVKKYEFQGHKLDTRKLIEELGDALWYIAECAEALGYSLEDIAEFNLNKLNERYPNGYSDERSVNRPKDLDEEDPVYKLKTAIENELREDKYYKPLVK